MTYRPDIDGLRAIAVLSVIVYHVWPFSLPGGFVGVDIFFVLSGYLISLQIYGEVRAGRFSIGEFYRRRIKRIAPAMILVVAVTAIVAELILRPVDSEAVARSAAWSILSLANVYFWFSEDLSYFASATEELPLLHLWSLGVEEQFYIFWPIVLMLVGLAFRSVAFAVSLIVVILASTLFGQWYYAKDPSFVFYMLPSRAGELMLGALVAWLTITDSPIQKKLSGNVVSSLALALLLLSLIFVSEDRVFPGFQALWPAAATALLIVSGQSDNVVSRLLANRLFVVVGLLSYSAYLWHWPLLAFLHYGGFSLTLALGSAVIAITFVLAALSYRFVEKPFRRSRAGLPSVFVRQFAIPALFVLAFAAVSLKSNGYALRWADADYQASLQSLRDSVKPAFQYPDVCQRQRLSEQDLTIDSCRHGPEGADSQLLLLGDSNAAQYVGMVARLAEAGNFSVRNVAVGSCPPLFGRFENYVESRRLSDCRDSLDRLHATVDDYDGLIIGGSWDGYANHGDLLSDLGETVRELASARRPVLILSRSPVIPGFDRLCREKALSFPFVRCAEQPVPLSADVIALNQELAMLANSLDDVYFFDANNVLCPDQICPIMNEQGSPYYYDGSHISLPTSWWLGSRIVEQQGVPDVFRQLAQAAGDSSATLPGDSE